MTAILQLETWLRTEYLSQLGLTMVNARHGTAVATWVPSENSNAASLFDRDLGIWFKFIHIDQPDSVLSTVEIAVQQSLSDSSQLLSRSAVPSGAVDVDGGWTISVIFLVHAPCRDEWEAAVQALRADSGFTEELSIDRVLFESTEALNRRLSEGTALPHLLFATRQLLKLPAQSISSWMSADDEVRKLLRRLTEKFPDPYDKKIVALMVTNLDDERVASAVVNQVEPIKSIDIRDMRNISGFSMDLEAAEGEVRVNIIHGPNGTGKSSIFEALSLSVARSSRRMMQYLRDRDVLRPTPENYVKNVLTPLDSDKQPMVLCNGIDILGKLTNDSDMAEQCLAGTDGTLLAQHDAREFVRSSSAALGASVLGGYSALAQSLQSYCEREYQAANAQRQEWLRKFGIIASITKEGLNNSKPRAV